MQKSINAKTRYILIVVFTTAMFLCYLVWGWRLTRSRLVNLLVSFHVLVVLEVGLVYIFYRYVYPQCIQKRFYRYFPFFLSAFLISSGVSAWGFTGNHITESVVPGLFGPTIIGTCLDPKEFASVPLRLMLFTYSGVLVLSLLLYTIDKLTNIM